MPHPRSLSTLAVSLLAFGASLAAWHHASAQQPKASPAIAGVIELFTSQGCSSCPPADALLKTYADRPGLLALTYHVDYWDYLGWRDTFANALFSERQRAYAAARGDGLIYTPQVVVNGRVHTTGSKPAKIDAALAATARDLDAARIGVELEPSERMIVVKVAARASTAPATAGPTTAASATVWLVAIQKSATVKIRNGENSGRTVTYTNIVRRIIPVGSWTGAALEVKLDRTAIVVTGVDASAIIVQSGATGPIYGASRIIDL